MSTNNKTKRWSNKALPRTAKRRDQRIIEVLDPKYGQFMFWGRTCRK
jgi:hypothetical protein